MGVLAGELVRLRPLAFADAEALRAIHRTPEVSAWWGAMDDAFPFDEPESTRWTIDLDGAVAGLVQCGEEPEPQYRHAWIDVFVAPALHGRGLGTDAVRRVLRHLLEDRGHHRVTIDPARANAAALRAYEKAGFRRVGVLEAAERAPDGSWRDAVLMEHVRRP